MAPFRIPFTSKKPVTPSGLATADENSSPQNLSSPYAREKPSLALGIKERTQEPNEFKLSSVNDSGQYMPPSPEEKRSFWGAKSPSTSTTTHRSVFSDAEPFSISRESFDSYRRSFDISGRSPIIHADSFNSRTSLDSRYARLPRPAVNPSTFEQPPKTQLEEAAFEEVGLNDEAPKPKKKSFLSRFGESNTVNTNSTEEAKTHHFHILPGRKRGQSGTGSELGNVNNTPANRPMSKGKAEISVR